MAAKCCHYNLDHRIMTILIHKPQVVMCSSGGVQLQTQLWSAECDEMKQSPHSLSPWSWETSVSRLPGAIWLVIHRKNTMGQLLGPWLKMSLSVAIIHGQKGVTLVSVSCTIYHKGVQTLHVAVCESTTNLLSCSHLLGFDVDDFLTL